MAYQTLPVEIEAQAQPVLTFADGSPLLLVGQPRGDGTGQSRGLVGYLSVAPALSWTNLPSKPLMLPLLHELVRQGLSEVNASRRAVAGSRPAVTGRRGVARLVHSGGAVVTVGNDQRASTAMDEPGVYTLEDDTLQPVGRMAVNVEPAAADTNAQSNAAVETWLTASGPWSWFDRSEPEAAVAQAEAKSPIALYVLLAVLGLVILETILARLFSHAGIDGPRKRGLLGTLKTEPTRARSRQDTGALAS